MPTPRPTPIPAPALAPDWEIVLLYSFDCDLLESNLSRAVEAAAAGDHGTADWNFMTCDVGLPMLVRALEGLDVTQAPAALVPRLTRLFERRDALVSRLSRRGQDPGR